MADFGIFDVPQAPPDFGGGMWPEYAATFAANIGAAVASPPTVTNFVAPLSKFSAASFDVTDDSGLFRAIVILAGFTTAQQDNTFPTDVIHIDEGTRTEFSYPYEGVRTAITNGWHYEVRRADGWPGPGVASRIFALPIDQGGSLG